MFLDIKGLPAAHRLVVTTARVRKDRYWQPDSGARIVYGNDGEYVSHFLDLFRQAVAACLRSRSGTVGLFMSGGLDSTSIAAVAQEMYQANRGVPRLLACSFAFDEVKECDERVYSQVMATELGVEIEYVDMAPFPLLTSDSHTYPDLETPIISWTAANDHALSLLKQRGANVVLFGTAPFYTRLGSSSTVYANRLLSLDLQVVKELTRYARAQGVPARQVLYRDLIRPLFPEALKPLARRLARRQPRSAVPEWISPDFTRRMRRHGRLTGPRSFVRLSRRVRSQHATWLGGISRDNYYRDRTAARFGLEARSPFLDRRVVDFLMAIPPKYGYQPGLNRWILREAMTGILPDVLRLRRTKTNFAPFYRYRLFSNEEQHLDAVFRNSILFLLGIADESRFRELQAEVEAGDRSAADLWPVITLELWLQRFYGVFSSGEQ